MSLSDIPTTPHWAIVTTTTVSIPSWTNPGHGYPAHIQTYIVYQAFHSEEEWKEKVEQLTLRPYSGSFRALRVTPAEVSVRVDVKELK